MPAPVPGWLTAVFVLLVIAMAALVVGAVAARRGAGPAGTVAGAIGGWLLLAALLARAGFFADFSRLPPRIPMLIVPVVILIVILCRSAAVGRLLDEMSAGWLVYPQAFRIVMELILWSLFVMGAAPAILTFEGRNMDILVGVSAPIVAWLCLTRRVWPLRVVVWWNVAGILVLVSVVAVAQLSAPTPFRIYDPEPPLTFIAHVPWIWLPAFLVPLAWGLHALSIRQLRRRG
jgi:hypothetical protein